MLWRMTKQKPRKKIYRLSFCNWQNMYIFYSPKNRHVKIVSPAARKRANMIQSWHRKTAAKSDTSSWHRFYGGFLAFSRLWCISLIFKTIHHLSNPHHVFVSSKTVQNACKTVNLATWNSQSCSPTLTILQPHFDYFALPNIQNDTPKSQERHSKPCFPPQKTWFFKNLT